MDELDSHRLTKSGKRIYRRRKETVERSFADSKEMHGVRYARFRGLAKVRGQCLLVAACQNMKKIALVLHRRDKQFASNDDPDPGSGINLIFAFFWPYFEGTQRTFWTKVLPLSNSDFYLKMLPNSVEV